MIYNKTEQMGEISHKMHDYTDWIVAIGKHESLICGKERIKVQELLDRVNQKTI